MNYVDKVSSRVCAVCPRMKHRSFSTVFQLAHARSLPLSTTQRVDSDGTYDATSDDETRTNDHDDDGTRISSSSTSLYAFAWTSDDWTMRRIRPKALGLARQGDVAWTPRLAREGCATPMTTMETRVDDSFSSDVRACVRRRASVRWVDGRMCTTASSGAHR